MKLWGRGFDHLIWSAKEGTATELMKWRVDDEGGELVAGVGEEEMTMGQLAEEGEATAT